MRKQDQLQELIQSLSASEKRYFKLFSGLQSGDKSYLQLFDALSTTEHYDADAISKKTGKSKKLLAHGKEHLKEVLFKALRIFHEDKIVKMSLMVQLSETELLDNKKLHELSLERARKGITECLKYEQFDYALRFIKVYNSAYLISGKGWIDTEMLELTETIAAKAHNENLYRLLHSRFTHLINNESFAERESNTGPVEKLLQNPLLESEKNALSVTAKILFCRIWGEYYMRKTTDIKRAIGFYQTVIQLLDDNKDLLPVFYKDYIMTHNAITSLHLSILNYTDAEKVLSKIQAWIKKEGHRLPGNLFSEAMSHTTFGWICFYVQSANFAKALPVFENFDNRDKKYLVAVSRYILQSMMCMAYFFEGNMVKALKAYNDGEDLTTQKPPAFYWLTQHLYLFIQYELGNHTVLSYQLKSYRRWCKKNNLTDEAFNVFYNMMQWLNKHQQGKTGFNEKKEFYLNYFDNLPEASEANRLFGTAKLVKWLSKIEPNGKI